MCVYIYIYICAGRNGELGGLRAEHGPEQAAAHDLRQGLGGLGFPFKRDFLLRGISP